MKNILEELMYKYPERSNDKLFEMLYLDDIVSAYEWNKDSMVSWKIIRKAVYWYAIGNLTKEEAESIDENDLSVDTVKLSDRYEDIILKKILKDIAYQSIEDSEK